MNRVRERPDYLSGGLMSAADYERAQTYQMETQRLRCRSLHTWGVASGLDVAVAADQLAVTIAPGMAVDAEGRQIVLVEQTVVDLSKVFLPEVYLSVALSSAYMDWQVFPKGAGYVRLADEVALSLTARPPFEDATSVLLARLSFTPERRLREPDQSLRQYCGLQVGRLTFPRPEVAEAAQPRIGVEEPGGAVVVRSALTDLFGDVFVDGGVSVGAPPTDGKAALRVQVPGFIAGPGVVSTDGDLLFGVGAYDLASLGPRDGLRLRLSGPGQDKAGETVKIAAALGAQTLSLVTPPAAQARNAVYSVERNLIARIRTGDLVGALAVAASGSVGVGGDPGAARLTVTAGDIRLNEGQRLHFAQGGSVQAADGSHAILFDADGQALDVREAGDIVFITDPPNPPDPSDPPGLIVSRTGCVGVGVANPGQPLVVDGVIRASEGLIFPDGSRQTGAVTAIPIGAVIAWWRPDSSFSWSGEGFQLCDGSTITDPGSPLLGQKTPDLRQQFIRGVVSYEEIGTTGGAATHSHGFVMLSHTHGMGHVHSVTGSTGKPEQTAGDRIAGGSIANADHTHSIDTTSANANPTQTGVASQTQAGSTLAASNLPPFMDLLMIMRIK
jgi:hypothetical protein